MAQRVITTLIDDIDGSIIDDGNGETVEFAIDGVAYEIDLSIANANALRQALKPYVKAGRKSGRGITPVNATKTDKARIAAIRDWAVRNGLEIPARGRIPQSIARAFDAAN